MGTALRSGSSTKANEMLHFDYMELERKYVGKHARAAAAIDGQQRQTKAYILVLKDDFSGFVELVPAEHEDAVTTARALLDWFKRFGIVRQ